MAILSACTIFFAATAFAGCCKTEGEFDMGYDTAGIVRSLMLSETSTEITGETPFIGLSDASAVGVDKTRFTE